ncbi:hypothetical protein L1D40_19840 [Shewanella insulae]|uniref:hypothetical protein n=1 Tax=Shewanella insulae TaxID=2681496 RepID=UPI001EFDC20D|nr:hypothetical protein [Shewanella insulae]MCG9757434.1 hypothetical protein [Shewanella insulae]
MQLFEITTNGFGDTTNVKALMTGQLGELESYAESLAKNQNVQEMHWNLEGGVCIGDEKITIDNKRSLKISETQYLLIDAT